MDGFRDSFAPNGVAVVVVDVTDDGSCSLTDFQMVPSVFDVLIYFPTAFSSVFDATDDVQTFINQVK